MKKLLSIISATAIALTMNISAFADKTTNKDQIVKAYMEYGIKEDEWEYMLRDCFSVAWVYNDLITYLNSDDFSNNSRVSNIDVTSTSDIKKLAGVFANWAEANDPILYPKVKWDLSDTKTYDEIKEDGLWTAVSTQDYETSYTAKKSGNQWIMTEDKTGKVVMKIPAIPTSFVNTYEKENVKSSEKNSSDNNNTDSNSNSNNSDNNANNSDSNDSPYGEHSQSLESALDKDNNDSSNSNKNASVNNNNGSNNNNSGKNNNNTNDPEKSSSCSSEAPEEQEEETSNSYVWVIVLLVIAAGAVVVVMYKKGVLKK